MTDPRLLTQAYRNAQEEATSGSPLDASESQAGPVLLASVADALAGASTKKAVTPAGLAAFKNALLNGASTALDTLKEVGDRIIAGEDATTALIAVVASKVPATRTIAGLDLSANRSAADLKTALDPVLISTYARKSSAWATGVAYVVGELVTDSGTLYRITTAHTSTGTSIDLTKATAVSAGGSTVDTVKKWQPSTAYTAGDIVQAPDGSFVQRTTTGTSGTTYSGTNWKIVIPVGGMLAAVSYEPAAGATYTKTGDTNFSDVDATNLVLPSFVGPPSGVVIVRLSAVAFISTAGNVHSWNLRDASGDIAGSAAIATRAASNASGRVHWSKRIQVTPGQTYTGWKWGFGVFVNTMTASIQIGGTAPAFGQALMEVVAAPL